MTIDQIAEKSAKGLIRGNVTGAIISIAHSLYGLLLIEKERRELELNRFYEQNPELFFNLPNSGGQSGSEGDNPSEPPEGQEDPVAARNRLLSNPRASATDIILGRTPRE
jgi:hypothetical protein